MNDNVKAIRLPLEICTKATDIYKSAYMKQNFSLESDGSVDIPYHARETALPFTYGDISEGLTQSQLKHVKSIFEESQFENNKQPFLKETNSAMIEDAYLKRKIVNKEKLQQSNDNSINKNKQTGKRGLLSKNKLNNDIMRSENCTRKLSENVLNKIILEQNEISNELLDTSHNDLNLNRGNSKDQPFPETKDLKRCQTPSFPCEDITSFSNRSTSPYPTFSPQICSTNVKNKKEYKIVTKNITDTNTNFAKDTSNFWYKPHITREEALILLGNAKPGSFILRNSTTYKNSFGLVLRVSRPPVNLPVVTDNSEFVRHYLLERTDCGVRLKGYHNEPVFTSLSAFVYQHTVDKLALPCKLIIPKTDFSLSPGQADLILFQEQLLAQGAACNVLYLFNYNTESLTGDEAIRKASNEMFSQFKYLKPYEVHFKVSRYGITLTDNKRLFFFRRHFSVQNISYFGLEPDNRLWNISQCDSKDMFRTIFAFVARPLAGGKDNQCHIFCDLSLKQPASAIISFAQKILPLTILGNKII